MTSRWTKGAREELNLLILPALLLDHSWIKLHLRLDLLLNSNYIVDIALMYFQVISDPRFSFFKQL